MAEETGKYVGDMESGRVPYAGAYIGDMEYGRIPAIGYRIRQVLTVQSSPDTAAAIAVSPADVNGDGNGTTQFTRTYEPGEVVSLTAPATHLGNNFSKWTLDGVDQVGNPISVTMDADHTAIAVYVAPPEPPAVPFVGVEMLKVLIPRYKFWKSAPAGETSYTNLEDGAEGKPIPEAYGVLLNVAPVCIDTVTGKYKFARRALKAIDALRDAGVTLTNGDHYVPDLANGEFTLLTTPLLTGGATYYFILESDYAINGTDYVRFARDNGGSYGQPYYDIDAAGNWTLNAGANFNFSVYGRTSIGGQEELLIDANDWTSWNPGICLRDAAARTRVAQKFVMPAGGPYYVSRIIFWCDTIGTPPAAPETKIQIVSAYSPAETTVGMKSGRLIGAFNEQGVWSQRAGGSNELRGDIQGYKNLDGSLMENDADVLLDKYVNILGGSAAGLNATDLAALKAARTQPVAQYLTEEKEFQQSLEISEASLLYKVLPSLAGDFAVRYFASGEPAGTPHLKEQHIRNFTMRRVWSNVYQRAKVKYYQDPSTGNWLVAEETSNIAQYLYNRQDTIEIETVLRLAADATQLAKDYLGTDSGSSRRVHLQYPTRIAEFDVLAGYGDLLIPTMKIKITLPRADYAGGVLNGVLFRILEVQKNPMNGESRIKATLDELTY